MDYFDKCHAASELLRGRIGSVPDVAIVLGSGLGDFAEGLSGSTTIPYGEIPNWPGSAVIGHAGKLVAFLHPKSTHGVLTELCSSTTS